MSGHAATSPRATPDAPPLTILHALAAAPFGGLERVVRGLAVGQARRGHRVVVAASVGDADHPFVRALRADGTTVHPVVTADRAYLRERAELSALMGRLAPDVVHTHGYRSDVVAAAAARSLGLAAVSTVHGFTGGGWRNRAYEWAQVRCSRRHQAVVAVSAPLARDLLGRGARADTLHVIRNAWDQREPLSVERARAALGFTGAPFHIGWAGRLSPEKGPDVMLSALEAMGDARWTASLLGDGPQRRSLESRAALLGFEGRVRFFGAVPEAGRLFAAFDAFVLSSRTEGTPMVLLEAMAAGVPIVATSVGGVPDMLSGEQALVVPADDPAALAAALRSIRSDPDAALRRCNAARRRLDDAFASSTWLEAYDTLYRTLLAAHHGTSAARGCSESASPASDPARGVHAHSPSVC